VQSVNRKNTNLMLSLLAVVAGMMMLAYAAVPLYSLFCQMTGYGGTPKIGAISPEKIIARDVTVTFNTDKAQGLPWQFKPLQKSITTQIGKRQLAFFEATNTSGRDITGMATYNVVPFKVGEYFVKMQCFCFEQQTIKAGETVTFPVSFYVDPELNNNKYLDDVTNITLSYTFFPLKEK
jgi:cytochrome c oxidase assembly protein subunit 11